MTTEIMTGRLNGHDVTHRGTGVDDVQCPYCGQPISRRQFKEIQANVEAEERARIAKVEKDLQEKFAREREQVEGKTIAAIEKAKRDTAKLAEQQVKALKANLEATVNQRVAAQREAFEKKMAETVAAERTKAYGERMKLDAQLQDLQRQLQRKTANQLGDEGEIDMFEALTAEFPGDDISRVAKGVPGADIVHRVIHNGAFCGTIIYDCKNHKRWQNRFTTKLREDQLAGQADHAVLIAAVFPAGLRHLAIKDGVIVAAPQRVIALAHLLRRQTVQTHLLRLGNKARVEKTAKLYDFMTSDRAADLWDQIAQITNDMLDLDRSETVAHQKTWSRRADLIRAVQGVHHDFASAIDRIIGGTETDEIEKPLSTPPKKVDVLSVPPDPNRWEKLKQAKRDHAAWLRRNRSS